MILDAIVIFILAVSGFCFFLKGVDKLSYGRDISGGLFAVLGLGSIIISVILLIQSII